MKNTVKHLLTKGIAVTAMICLVSTIGCMNEKTSDTAMNANTGSQDNVQHEPVEVIPPFWTVEDKESGATLYMMGSMHLGEPGVTYPDYVMDAYESCDKMAVEINSLAPDMNELITGMQKLVLPTGTTLKDCMGEEDYNSTVKFMKDRNLYNAQLDSYIPYYLCSSMAVVMAGETGLSSEYGTEAIFLAKAAEDGKEIIEIESIGAQYSMMADIPMTVQVESLKSVTSEDGYAEELASTKELYEGWKTFDTEYLETLNDVDYSDIPEEMIPDFEKFQSMMYGDRQVGMAEKAVEFLESGEDVFMFVGAAHYYIEDDIITLLERAGYEVNEVRPDSTLADAA